MSDYEMILTEIHDRVGLVRLNRPEALNALNSALIEEVMEALNDFDNDGAIGAIVITGSERAFAAGADIKEMADASAIDMLRREHIAPFDRIMHIRKPIIAAVSGWCLGGGNEFESFLSDGLADERRSFYFLFASQDQKEGMQAFAEKRKPEWKGK